MADDSNNLQVTFGAKTDGLVQGAKTATTAVNSVTSAVNAQARPLQAATQQTRHHVATATTLDGLCDVDHVPYMFYRSTRP